MKKALFVEAARPYAAPQAESCSVEAASFIALSGSTEDLVEDEVIYNW
ncbi:MAG: hypothetical protein IJS66_07785 [Bacteroidales bacterium]|nr:hypothetical protein [Bacteroidales bacterium]